MLLAYVPLEKDGMKYSSPVSCNVNCNIPSIVADRGMIGCAMMKCIAIFNWRAANAFSCWSSFKALIKSVRNAFSHYIMYRIGDKKASAYGLVITSIALALTKMKLDGVLKDKSTKHKSTSPLEYNLETRVLQE